MDESTTRHSPPVRETDDRPLWFRWAPSVTMFGALAYGLLRLSWVLGERPWLPPSGDDLGMFSDWGVVVLCGAAVLIAGSLWRLKAYGPGRIILLVVGTLVSIGLAAASFMLLLDVASLVLPGSGAMFHWAAFFSRLGSLTVGVALGATVLAAHRSRPHACFSCGRSSRSTPAPAVPEKWIIAAAYMVVIACALRVSAQLVADQARGESVFIGADAESAAVVFGLTAVAAGTLLPLALVHAWGRVWPGWTGPLAHRPVPRWLVLGPGGFIAAGMTLYFMISMIQLISDPSATEEADYPPGFFWITVPAYLLWGLGLCIAAVSYWTKTRPPCPRCSPGVGMRKSAVS